MIKGNNSKIKRDLVILFISLAAAAVVWQVDFIDDFLVRLENARFLSAFMAGLFFTSAFTTMPAVAFLVKIAQFNSPITIALLGATGAVIGDSIMFYFIRDRLVKDFTDTVKKPRLKRIIHFFRSKTIRCSVGIISGILIALPLPTDETAFTLMGISKIKTLTFLLITFSFNFVAIYLISRGVLYFTV